MTDNVRKYVLVVGVFSPGSTNVPQILSFSRAGFEVIPVNYRRLIQKYNVGWFSKHVKYLVTKYAPTLVLFAKLNGVPSDIIAWCSEHTVTWEWLVDPVQTLQRCPEVITHAKYATFSSCTSLFVKGWLEQHGVINCHHILEGLDWEVLHPVDIDLAYKADISFIGTKTPERDMYLKLLTEKGYNVKFYGPQYSGREVIDHEFAKICSSSKCMLSLNTHNNIPHYFSDRVIRTLGCGALTLHLDPTGTMTEYFVDGHEIVYFKDEEDLIDKLGILEDSRECGRIAGNGYNKVMAGYTWDHSVAKILRIIDRKHNESINTVQ